VIQTIRYVTRQQIVGPDDKRANWRIKVVSRLQMPSSMPIPPSDARVAELQHRLLDESDPQARARIHLELARRSVRDGQLGPAVRHLRETLRFDASSAAARQLLADLGQPVQDRPEVKGIGRRVRRLVRKVTRRTDDA